MQDVDSVKYIIQEAEYFARANDVPTYVILTEAGAVNFTDRPLKSDRILETITLDRRYGHEA